MNSITLATNNKNKVLELKQLIPSNYEIVTLYESGIQQDIPETGSSFKENALQKAQFVAKLTKNACIADDSGLEVEALNGEPGIYSARYAGPEQNDEANIQKLLTRLKGLKNRKARFVCVIAFVFNDTSFTFEGIINGTISETRKGEHGFGYDPVFIPENYSLSFAEMDPVLKNKISHRSLAVNKLVDFLNRGYL